MSFTNSSCFYFEREKTEINIIIIGKIIIKLHLLFAFSQKKNLIQNTIEFLEISRNDFQGYSYKYFP